MALLKQELVVKLMQALGIKTPNPTGEWMMGACPLAPWRHKKGTDSRASFGINLKSTRFNCFTCSSGTSEELVSALELYVSQDPEWLDRFDFKTAREILLGFEEFLEPLPDYEEVAPETKPFVEWPKWALDEFLPWSHSPRSQWYLEKGRVEKDPRNQPVDPVIADQLRMLYDPKFDRLVCPYWTWSGKLAGARGRAINPESKVPHFDYTWGKTKSNAGVNNASLVWYNEKALETAANAHKPIVVVEGQFDCANILRVYPHTIAGLTAKSSAEKITKLQSCDGVIVLLDNDEAGDTAYERYHKFLYGKVPLWRGKIPEGFKDPAQLTKTVMEDMFSEFLV